MTQTHDPAAGVLHEFFSAYARRRTGASAPACLDADMSAEMRAVRDECRREEGGGGMCHWVTDFVEGRWGWPRIAVAYLDMEARVICGAHYANILPDGSILDPTADQFGEGRDIRLVPPNDPEYRRYRPEWYPDYNPQTDPWCARIAEAFGVTYDGCQDDELAERNRAAYGEGWWVSDRTALADYWRMTAAYAESAKDSSYLSLALRKLSDMGHTHTDDGPRP